MSSLFGWCQTGHHKECREKYQKLYIGTVGRGRNKKLAPIMLDEYRICECKCHKKGKDV